MKDWKLILVEDNPICANVGRHHSVVIKYDGEYPNHRPKKDQACCKCLAKFVVVEDEN